MTLLPRKSAQLSIDVIGEDRLIRTLRKLAPKAVDAGLESGIRAATIDVTATVKDLLDGPVLNRRSNRLWRSIQPEVYRKTGTVIGIVGTDVEYAAIHEFGGTIRPKNEGGLLAWRGASTRSAKTGRFEKGEFIFAKEVEMPKRPFMSRAFKARQKRIGRLIRSHVLKSVAGTMKTGRVKSVDKRVGVGYDAD